MSERAPIEVKQSPIIPLTPEGILSAEELCAAKRDNKPPEVDFDKMNEHTRSMYFLRPGYEKKTIRIKNKRYNFLVRESKIKDVVVAKSFVYIGDKKLPEGTPFESTELYQTNLNGVAMTVTLNRYQGTEVTSQGKTVAKDEVLLISDKTVLARYNPHSIKDNFHYAAANASVKLMGIPPQNSMG